MPSVRVTITVPEEVNRGIQAVRGWLLMNQAVDVSYSGFIEMLVWAGAMRLSTMYSHQPALDDETKHLLSYGMDVAYRKAAGYFPSTMVDLPADQVAELMVPAMLGAARVAQAEEFPNLYTKSGKRRTTKVATLSVNADVLSDVLNHHSKGGSV